MEEVTTKTLNLSGGNVLTGIAKFIAGGGYLLALQKNPYFAVVFGLLFYYIAYSEWRLDKELEELLIKHTSIALEKP